MKTSKAPLILVTGAGGFVGRHLVPALLDAGYRVRSLVREPVTDLAGEIVLGDVCERSSLASAFTGVNTVIHLAATHGSLSFAELHATNYVGTSHILTLAAESKVRHVIYFSSVAVYGEALAITEESPFNPYDAYGQSKKEVEEFISSFRQTHLLPITIIRLPHIYGPSGVSNLTSLFRQVARRRYFIVGNGENLMSVIYVGDLVSAVLLLLKNKQCHGRDYILTDGQSYTQKALITTIAETCRVPVPFSLPFSFCLFFGFVGDLLYFFGLSFPLTRARVRNLARSRSYTIHKAQQELGYSPQYPFVLGAPLAFSGYQQSGSL